MKLEEFATLAGVSKTTASIILNGHAARYRISEKTCQHVLFLAAKHQYIANAQAASLRSKNTKLIALVLPDLIHYGFARLSKHLERLSRASGYQLLISCSDECPETETQAIKTLLGRKVQAIITVSSLSNHSIYHMALEQNIPVVMVDRTHSDAGLDYVVSDDRIAARQLTELMLKGKPGHTAYFGGIPSLENSQLRLQGFHDAVKACASDIPSPFVSHRDFSIESGFCMMANYFKQCQSLPERLFTASCTLMEGALKFTQQYQDILPNNAVWGTFGDNDLLDFMPLTIHSACQKYQEMAKTALSIVEAKLEGDEAPYQITLPRDIICRAPSYITPHKSAGVL